MKPIQPRGCWFRPASSQPKLKLLDQLHPVLFFTVLAGWPMRSLSSAPARYETDLRYCNCHRSKFTHEAKGFQRVVGGHYLVVYFAHSVVRNSYRWYVRGVYLFRESRAGSQVAASKRPTRQITFKPIPHDRAGEALKTKASELGWSRRHCLFFSSFLAPDWLHRSCADCYFDLAS